MDARMSLSRRRSSRIDRLGVLQDAFADQRFESALGGEIDFALQEGLKLLLKKPESNQADLRARVKVHQEIEVAAIAKIGAASGAEEQQLPNFIALANSSDLRKFERQFCAGGHRLFSILGYSII